MDSIPQIVLQNPYRILGVYANSAKRDIVANKGKATAFLNVNRPVEYPLDLKGIMPSPTRTLDSMNEAEAHLAIAKEQIKYVQFWFVKITPIDDIAFNHLLAGNMDGAIEMWSKQESMSSLQNRLVCYLIENNYQQTLKTAERLYNKFGDNYISKIDANCTLQMTATDLLHQFIDSLGEEIGMQRLIGFELDEETKAYISSQTVGPLINKISAEVDKAKKVDHKDSRARIEAASKLCANTKEDITQLKRIIPSSDPQYIMIADKLGLEILQCGIDYFHNSEEDDAPQKAMWILMYARSVVIGTLAKQRCEENIKILQKIIDELPPKEVMAEDKAIKEELKKFERLPKKISNAITLLNNTKPHLQSIKNRLGRKNDFYLKISTIIVRHTLQTIVLEINNSQKPNEVELGWMTYELPSFMLSPEQKREMLQRIKDAVSTAWQAIVIMDSFDKEPNFKQYYAVNRKTIKSMCEQLDITYYDAFAWSFSSFDEYGGFFAYLKSSDSSRWQAALFVQVISILISLLLYNNNQSYFKEMSEYLPWGIGIGACAWICILVDKDDKEFDASSLGNGGCIGVIPLMGLLVFYWIYKVIRLTIDEIKGA